MRRREFIAGLAGVTAWPVALKAQQPARVYRLGFLRNGSPPQTFVEGLRQGMRELGYVEGQNIRIEYGLAPSADELPAAAAELVRLDPDERSCRRGDSMKSANENRQPNSLSRLFTDAATAVAHATGKPLAFGVCVLVVVIWAISGHFFGY